MARVVNYEGRRINVPDDATDDEVRAIIESGGPAAAPAASAVPTVDLNVNPMVADIPAPSTTPDPTANLPWDQKIAHALAAGSQAGLRGIADLAGAPIDLLAAGSNLLNFGLNKGLEGGANASNAMFGTDFHPEFVNGPAHDAGTLFNKGLEAVGLPAQESAGGTIANVFSEGASAVGAPPFTPEEMSPGENAAQLPIRLGAGGAATGAAIASRVPKLVERMTGPAPKSQLGDIFTRQYIANPAKTITGDAFAGAGSGVGSDIADDVAPGNMAVKIPFMLAGGTGGATIAGAANTGKHAIEAGIDQAASAGSQRSGTARHSGAVLAIAD